MHTKSLVRRILIVDDKRENRVKYADIILHGPKDHENGHPRVQAPIRPEVCTAGNAEEAMAILRESRDLGHPFDVLVTDLVMQPLDGLWLINHLRYNGFNPESLDVIFLSQQEAVNVRQEEIDRSLKEWEGASKRNVAVVFRDDINSQLSEANESGGNRDDEFIKNVWKGIWNKLDESAYREIAGINKVEIQEQEDWQKTFVTRNSELKAKIKGLLECFAKTDVPILITGESGTGKEVLVSLIHAYSNRRNKEVVPVNVPGLTETLLESEMFGHEKGAFTGAIARRLGRFEIAKESTIFLDEIGDLPLQSQVKLLRVIETKILTRVGGSELTPIDFRLVAATKKNLEDEVEAGKFREDLYYRLGGLDFQFRLSPLRDRKEDIPILIEHFWKKPTKDIPNPNLRSRDEELADDAIAFLSAMDWPGNVRELKNYIEFLKVRHPIGRPVTEKELRQHRIPEYFYGLDEHSTFTSRYQHMLFFKAIKSAIRKAKLPKLTSQLIVDEVVKVACVFFQKPGEISQESAKTTISNAWNDHLRDCRVCKLMWKQSRLSDE